MLKTAIFILVTLVIAQAIHSMPTPAEGPMDISDAKQLVHSAAVTYVEFFGYATEKYRELFEKVLTASESDANSDPELKSVLMPFAEFVAVMYEKKEKTREKLQTLFDESTELANKYDRGVPVDASEAEKKVAQYMYDAKAMKTKFDILLKYHTSLEQFANNVRKYLKSSPEDESSQRKKIHMWYMDWQREHNWQKKNDLMLSFIEIFNSEEDDRSKLVEKSIKNILVYLNTVVMGHKNIFKRALKDLEAETMNEDIKHEIDMMKEFIDRAEKVHSLEGREITFELLRLFRLVQDRRRWYAKHFNESENKITDIMTKNGEVDLEVRDMILTFVLGEELTQNVEEYFEIIPKEKMEEESKLIGWFEDVMDEKDYEAKAGKLVGLIEALRA